MIFQGEKMFRVLYDIKFSTDTRREEAEVTQSLLDRMRKLESKGEYYKNIQVIEFLGYEDRTWWETWYELGMANKWIRNAYDPRPDAFVECKSINYLIDRMEHGNWCLGAAFFYRDICFINQDDGGSEWLVIRKGIAFDSWSIGRLLRERNGKEKFKDTLNRMVAATDIQLEKQEYMDAGPISYCGHCQCKLYPGSSDIFKDADTDVCESCWCNKKIYLQVIEAKVRANERLTANDLRHVVYEDYFLIAGQQGLEGWFICWNNKFAIGKPRIDEHRIEIYNQLSDGSWTMVDDYYARK